MSMFQTSKISILSTIYNEISLKIKIFLLEYLTNIKELKFNKL
jgi:hypothetical protein